MQLENLLNKWYLSHAHALTLSHHQPSQHTHTQIHTNAHTQASTPAETD